MSPQITAELTFWFIYLIAGFVLSFSYDFLRIFRNVTVHSSIAVALEDLLYWIGVTIALFGLLYRLSDGVIRWFAVMGLFLGMLLYKKIFSGPFVRFMSTVIGRTLDIVHRLLSVPLNLVKCGFVSAFTWLKKLFLIIKKKLTGNIKEVNIILCKHFCRNRSQEEIGEDNEP